MVQIYGWRLHLKPQPWWQPEVTTDLTEPVLEVKVTLVEHCHACQCAAHPSAAVPDTLQPAICVAKPATTSSSIGGDIHIVNYQPSLLGFFEQTTF